MYEDDDLEDELKQPSAVPTLESLCVKALALHVHSNEPHELALLPYGGGKAVIDVLIQSGRLRPESLCPLLRDWSTADAAACSIGGTLVGAAPGCRGLAGLAAQRLRFTKQRQDEQRARHGLQHCGSHGGDHVLLPAGTIARASVRASASEAANAAR